MRYAVARFKTQIREATYRNYVTDALYAVVNGGHFQMTLTKRYAELVQPQEPQKEDTRTQEEIVADVWAAIKGKKKKKKGGELKK